MGTARCETTECDAKVALEISQKALVKKVSVHFPK